MHDGAAGLRELDRRFRARSSQFENRGARQDAAARPRAAQTFWFSQGSEVQRGMGASPLLREALLDAQRPARDPQCTARKNLALMIYARFMRFSFFGS